MIVRLCRPDEADSLTKIAQDTFAETFKDVLDAKDLLKYNAKFKKEGVAASWLRDSLTRVWIAETDNVFVGYLALTPPDLPVPIHSDDLEVKKIYLLQKYQGSGTGRKLLEAAIKYAKEFSSKRLLLGVYAKNKKAIEFYLKAGFVQIGTRQFLVGNTHYDDIVLALKLEG